MRVFDDDEHIINFLANDGVFKKSIIDDEEHQADLQSREVTKGNFMPTGVSTLEGIFDLQNKLRKQANVKTNSSYMQFELINLGTEAEPKYVNLGNCCSPGERSRFIKLFQQYKDIFSWTYEYIKTYDTSIIQHIIPIKTGIKPFQQQLKKMHPKLDPLIQNEVKKLLDAKISSEFDISNGWLIYF